MTNEPVRGGIHLGETTPRRIPLFHSIKVKTWLGIFLISIIPLAVLGIYAFNILTTITRDLLIKSNLQAVQQVKTEVDQYVNLYEDLIKYLKTDGRLATPDSPAAAEALRQMDFSYEFIDRIVLVATDGIVLAHSARTASGVVGLEEAERRILVADQTIRFERGLFIIKAPLRPGPESPTLVATVSFLKLRKTLEGMAFGTSFLFFLVTRDGENILDQKDFPADLVKLLVKQEFGGYDIAGPGETDPTQVAVILPILQYGLRIVVVQDAGEVYSVVSTIKRNIYLVIFVVLVLAFSAGTLFSIRITAPIITIADKANQISGGNLKVNVHSDRKDEIGFLATCFNNMTSRIRKKVFELSAMYRISQIINNATSYQKALDETLTYIVTVFLAQRGSIMLVADQDDQLVLRSVRFFGDVQNSAGDSRPRIALRVGEGIAGLAISSGQPVLCTNCRTDPRFKPYPADAADLTPTSLLAVPLIVQGKAFGVINLVDRSDNLNFTADDQETLLTVGNQVAMSIDNAKLHELAITDGLTQLFIHRYFQIKLDDEIKRARRYNEPLSLLMFDIDHFKTFNDNYGHQQGDNVLRETAKIVRDAVRGSDVPCRYGGEEFTIILPHTTAQQALVFAERLRIKINQFPFMWGDKQLHVSISIGIAEFPLMAGDKQMLVKKADQALYHCKNRGRNCTSLYSDEM